MNRAPRGDQWTRYLDAVKPVGTQLELRPQASWQIATIEVDNPSGRWIYIEPLSIYIPPYTIGLKKEFHPTTVSVSWTYADPPAGGGINVDDGTQIVVTLHSDYLGEDNGLTYKIATDTDKIVTAIRTLREGWGDLALDEDIHIAGTAGGVILPDTGGLVAVSYATVRQRGAFWIGGGLQGFMLFTLSFDGGPGPDVSTSLAYPDETIGRFPFPPRFQGTGDLRCDIDDGGYPSPIQNQWKVDVWYREVS